jgi:hypothetical protein
MTVRNAMQEVEAAIFAAGNEAEDFVLRHNVVSSGLVPLACQPS